MRANEILEELLVLVMQAKEAAIQELTMK